MRGLTKFNPAFLAGISTPPISGGGSGANDYNMVFTPNGGVYTPGMEVVLSWDSAPAGLTNISVQRQWKNPGDPDSAYQPNTFYAYDVPTTSPQTIILQDHPVAIPGRLQRLQFIFVGYDGSIFSILIPSADFTY